MLRAVLLFLTFALTLAARVWGIHHDFQLMRDQIRDWDIALRPFGDLPLVGPATHVGGYTIGPAFYWLMWAIRVTVGPWFDYLPHAGGIGQAILHSAADALLLYALWRRTGSIWIALVSVTLIASAAFDLSLSAIIWNPMVGTTLAKAATALVLLDWHRSSGWRAGAALAVAWCAVHAYTGSVFVTVGVFAAAVVDPLARGERRTASRNVGIGIAVVVLLQVPYLVHQVRHRFDAPAMGAVYGSVGRVVSGESPPELRKSVLGFEGAMRFIITAPRELPYLGWLLLICGGLVAVRYARDPAVIAVTLLPQIAAIAGYSLFLDDLDRYYYLPLTTAAVLTLVLGVLSWTAGRVHVAVGAAALLIAALPIPEKVRFAHSFNRMPQYGLLVDASRKIRAVPEPMRAIRTEFKLPPTASPEFIYQVLGGRLQRSSPWMAIVLSDGGVVFRKIDQP